MKQEKSNKHVFNHLQIKTKRDFEQKSQKEYLRNNSRRQSPTCSTSHENGTWQILNPKHNFQPKKVYAEEGEQLIVNIIIMNYRFSSRMEIKIKSKRFN